MMLDEQLLEAVLLDRDGLEPWRILGDALESAGDPRGRLVGLMLANEAKPALKLITARKEWLKTHAAALVPPDLDEQTLVWRRGFLAHATIPGPRLLELVDHPSLRFLEHAVLGVGAPVEQLEGHVLPWRSVELLALDDGRLDPRPVLKACPRLRRLALRVPREQTELLFDEAPQLTELELERATPKMLLAAAKAFPNLKVLRWMFPRERAAESHWEESGLLARLERLTISADNQDSLEQTERQSQLRLAVLGSQYEDVAGPGVLETMHSHYHDETAWLLFPPFDCLPAVRDLGLGHQVTELAARTSTVRFGAVELGVVELRAPPGPLTLGNVADALAERSGTGRCLGFAMSTSQRAVASWVVKNGPARTAADYSKAAEVFRKNVELLFGVDPGIAGLEEVRRSLHGIAPKWLFGKPTWPWPRLITDAETFEISDEELEEEELEDEDSDQYWEDVIETEEQLAAEAEANAAAPLVMEGVSDRRLKPEVEEEDDEDDEPFRDAVDANVYDIWTQTPVEPDDDLEEPVTRAYDEPEPPEPVLVLGVGEESTSCAHCGENVSTEACIRCGDLICVACSDGDEVQRTCRECEP
jgi:hypothetical protein